MYDNSFWATGAGDWGTVTIGGGSYPPVYGGYPAYPTYPTYPGGYPSPGSFGPDSTIVLIGAVIVVMLLLK